MTDNNKTGDEPGSKTPVDNVVPFAVKDRRTSVIPPITTEAQTDKSFGKYIPWERQWTLELDGDRSLEVQGAIGLTPAFLAMGDKDGNIRSAYANGTWKTATDITPVPVNDNDTGPAVA